MGLFVLGSLNVWADILHKNGILYSISPQTAVMQKITYDNDIVTESAVHILSANLFMKGSKLYVVNPDNGVAKRVLDTEGELVDGQTLNWMRDSKY